jgi:hypothetical protein
MTTLRAGLSVDIKREIHLTDDRRPWWKGYIGMAEAMVAGKRFRIEVAGSMTDSRRWVERERIAPWR